MSKINKYDEYDQTTISKFEIVGSYFINLYYNEFYSKAKALKIQNKCKTITEAYKYILKEYCKFTNKNDFLNKLLLKFVM